MCVCVHACVCLYRFLYMSVCICIYVYVCGFACLDASACMCKWNPEVNIDYLSLWLSGLVFETGSLREPQSHWLTMLVGQRAPGLAYLYLSVLGFQTCATMLGFTWVMGIILGFLMLTGQECYPQSHLPSPHSCCTHRFQCGFEQTSFRVGKDL